MKLRRCVIALSVAALLVGSVSQSKAIVVVPASPSPLPMPYPISAGVFITGGFIGAAAALCVYDIWLKLNGFKNWDGSPKTAQSLTVSSSKSQQTKSISSRMKTKHDTVKNPISNIR